MIVKTHKVNDGSGRVIVAVCDDNLVGKRFEEKGLCLDLNSEFYKGEKKTEEEAAKAISSAYIVNFVGKKAVALGAKLGLISDGKIIMVKHIPHAQAIL